MREKAVTPKLLVRAKRRLRNLGSDASEVKVRLRQAHIRLRGVPTTNCPITQVLRRVGYRRVLVHTGIALGVCPDGTVDRIELPYPVRNFIAQWDLNA